MKTEGEEVKQILVDGKPFFVEDPDIALKSLPAEMIEKIQIYDSMSEQAQFTGFDDGQSSKKSTIFFLCSMKQLKKLNRKLRKFILMNL